MLLVTMLPYFGITSKHYPAPSEHPDSATRGHLDDRASADEFASENPAETPFRY